MRVARSAPGVVHGPRPLEHQASRAAPEPDRRGRRHVRRGPARRAARPGPSNGAARSLGPPLGHLFWQRDQPGEPSAGRRQRPVPGPPLGAPVLGAPVLASGTNRVSSRLGRRGQLLPALRPRAGPVPSARLSRSAERPARTGDGAGTSGAPDSCLPPVCRAPQNDRHERGMDRARARRGLGLSDRVLPCVSSRSTLGAHDGSRPDEYHPPRGHPSPHR